MPTYAKNRKARYDYTIEESFEGGLVLLGSEVKSIRAGQVSIQESFIQFDNVGNLWLVGAHISPYEQAYKDQQHEPTRKRKVLMHKRELIKLNDKVSQKGLTLVPLSLYTSRGKIKVSIGLVKGKKKHDKRDSIKERDTKREMDRAMKSY